MTPRLLEQLGPVVGEQGLVGRDHVLARGEGAQDEGPRRLEPADELDDDLDGRVVEDLPGVGDEVQAREVDPLALADEVGVGDRCQGEPAVGPLLHLGAVRVEDLDDARADRTESEKADPDLVHRECGVR